MVQEQSNSDATKKVRNFREAMKYDPELNSVEALMGKFKKSRSSVQKYIKEYSEGGVLRDEEIQKTFDEMWATYLNLTATREDIGESERKLAVCQKLQRDHEAFRQESLKILREYFPDESDENRLFLLCYKNSPGDEKLMTIAGQDEWYNTRIDAAYEEYESMAGFDSLRKVYDTRQNNRGTPYVNKGLATSIHRAYTLPEDGNNELFCNSFCIGEGTRCKVIIYNLRLPWYVEYEACSVPMLKVRPFASVEVSIMTENELVLVDEIPARFVGSDRYVGELAKSNHSLRGRPLVAEIEDMFPGVRYFYRVKGFMCSESELNVSLKEFEAIAQESEDEKQKETLKGMITETPRTVASGEYRIAVTSDYYPLMPLKW